MSRLNHKVALVTGGASGLGKVIAERLAADGASVVITDVQTSLGQLVASRSGWSFLPQDVTDEARWSEVVAEIQSRHGGLHILVNNAGITNPSTNNSPEESRLEDWRRMFAVNVEGVFLGCRAVIPAMRASGGGSIINISSIAGILAMPFAFAYGASKAAVRHMTKSVAQYCVHKKLNIRCNSVHPGMVKTPPWEKSIAEKARKQGVSAEEIEQKIQSIVPMGEWTRAEDVASAVVFLASEESRHITGAPLMVDGGLIHCDSYHTRLAGE